MSSHHRIIETIGKFIVTLLEDYEAPLAGCSGTQFGNHYLKLFFNIVVFNHFSAAGKNPGRFHISRRLLSQKIRFKTYKARVFMKILLFKRREPSKRVLNVNYWYMIKNYWSG